VRREREREREGERENERERREGEREREKKYFLACGPQIFSSATVDRDCLGFIYKKK